MDQNQQETVLRAIALSSGVGNIATISAQDRQTAFRILEDLKAFDGRITVCISWLQVERHILQNLDITVPVKLYAASILETFLQKGYTQLNENDRLALRNAVLTASRQVAPLPISDDGRILGNKLASLLAGLMVRDFPQRWKTFFQDVFSPIQLGGLWYVEPGDKVHVMGVKICLECLRLISEDCTDSDFNLKISTTRRNDVLIGLNEVSGQFLPLLFNILEHFTVLQQSKLTLHNMRQFLLSGGRNLPQMNQEESRLYGLELERKTQSGKLVADCLVTLERFCHAMPLDWILGNSPDFCSAFLHMLREPVTQIHAVACLEQLAARKLDAIQWMRLVSQLPTAVGGANQAAQLEQEMIQTEQSVGGRVETTDSLTLQLSFHRPLSRMLAYMISMNVSHVTTDKQMLNSSGPRYDSMSAFFRLLVDMIHHPSGTICGEQVSTWIGLLRDPQVVKSNILSPFVEELLSALMDHSVRIRWEDVEEGRHPFSQLIEASWYDEEEYDAWFAELRSKSSLLFKLIGNVEPKIAAKVVSRRVLDCLAKHGNGDPRDHTDPSNGQLTPKSEACIQFEGLVQPLDNVLDGLPTWSVVDDKLRHESSTDSQRAQVRSEVRLVLGQMASAIVTWTPTYLWLKFRKTTLLESLKHYWKYDPATLLQGVDSLLGYLGASDDWNQTNDPDQPSGETISLRKKSGVSLVVIAKKVPNHLVPWLAELSEATRRHLSSNSLLPPNRMHLYEFLSCVATAVDDPVARANFISNVLADAMSVLESAEVQQAISSPEMFLSSLGISQAATNPDSVTNLENVARVDRAFCALFSAMNQLLSVGKRCHEAARKRPNGGIPLQDNPNFNSANMQNFPDEGPVSIQDLVVNDPFVPLWPRILPILIRVVDVTLSLWHPRHQATLLRNNIQRYMYAISDDEAFLSKVHDSHSGGVFGEGGTAGSVVAGTDRRDQNLVPKWSGWFNELRNSCFQMLGMFSGQRAMFAPEVAPMFPSFVSVVANSEHLQAMENRHLVQYMKQFLEILMVTCPSTLYTSHLSPILGPVLEHVQYRLEKSWDPIVNPVSQVSNKPLFTSDCDAAATLASSGGDAWYSSYYARGGLFVGDLDTVTAEAAVDKARVELSRCYSDMLQTAFALKGDWALVLATQSKEDQAVKKNDLSKLLSGPKSRINHGGAVNADGTPRRESQIAVDARKNLRITRICHFMLLEDERVAGHLTLSVIQCLSFPDGYTVRRCTKLCHRILETVAWSARYTDMLVNKMFPTAVRNIVTEPKWMVGIEWDQINLIRDIYCRLVLGQVLQPGGQGPGVQQLQDPRMPNHYEQAKSAETPLQGGGVLISPSYVPRQILARLPGVGEAVVATFEDDMRRKRSAKDQKDFLRDLLRTAAENSLHMDNGNSRGEAGVFDRAVAEESLLNQKKIGKAVALSDIPEKLVTHSMVMKRAHKEVTDKEKQNRPEGLAAFQL